MGPIIGNPPRRRRRRDPPDIDMKNSNTMATMQSNDQGDPPPRCRG
jgi:hypothetical protein